MSYFDFHSHILPGIDDGAQTVETSCKMLQMLHNQGVEKVVFTPHLWSESMDFDEFCKNRENALKKLLSVYDPNTMPQYLVGAEVKIMPKVSKLDLARLSFADGYILCEMPNTYGDWILNEIETIMLKGYKIIFAHIERPFISFSKTDFKKLIDYKAFIYQLNIEALKSIALRRHFVGEYKKYGGRFILGSDAHGIDERKPDFDAKILKKRSMREFAEAVYNNSKIILG